MFWKQDPITTPSPPPAEPVVEDWMGAREPIAPPPPAEPVAEDWMGAREPIAPPPPAEPVAEDWMGAREPIAPPPPAEPVAEDWMGAREPIAPPLSEEQPDEPSTEDWVAELVTLTVGGRQQMDRIETHLQALGAWPERLAQQLAETTVETVALRGALEDLRKELGRIGRQQLKANMIDETRLERWQAAVQALEAALERREGEVASIRLQQRRAVEAAQREWLTALLPILDGLDDALTSGETKLAWIKGKHTAWEMEQSQRRGIQALLRRVWSGSPALDQEAIAALNGWLDGLRLLRERAWTLLEDGGVRPIPTTGERFDPHLHVAAGTDERDDIPPGVIVSEQRRGYRLNGDVLRFAQVIVARRPVTTETINVSSQLEGGDQAFSEKPSFLSRLAG